MSAMPLPPVGVSVPAVDLQLVPPRNDPQVRALRGSYADVPRDQRVTALNDELVAVGAKLGLRIVIPDRSFTDEEMQIIRVLRQILRTAEITRTWTSMAFAMLPIQVTAVLDTFGQGGLGVLGGESAVGETLELFGARLFLGPVRFLARQARLANEQEVRARLRSQLTTSPPIAMHFVPGQDDSLIISYPEWGLTPGTAGVARRLDAAERIVLLEPEQSRRLRELFDLGAHRPLTQAEQHEMEELVDEHAKRLYARQVGLYALQRRSDADQARHHLETEFADALTWWEAFENGPAREEVIAAWARQREGAVDE